jgi:hypothetical protein
MPYIGRPLNAGNLAVQSGTGDGSDTTPIATLDYCEWDSINFYDCSCEWCRDRRLFPRVGIEYSYASRCVC